MLTISLFFFKLVSNKIKFLSLKIKKILKLKYRIDHSKYKKRINLIELLYFWQVMIT